MIPKVSICIPTYRQPDLLCKALQSVFAQSFTDYEIIITDDSPDDCVQNAIKTFLLNEKIRYYKNSETKGSPENWNEAVRMATGEYIKILHHDDYFPETDSLYKFVEMLDNNAQADFAFSSTIVCGLHEETLYVHSPAIKQLAQIRNNPNLLFPHNLIGSPSATIYRRTVNKQYDRKLKWVVDVEFYIRLLKENPEFVFCSKPLITCRLGVPGQVTAECIKNKNVQLFEWLYLYQKIDDNSRYRMKNLMFLWQLLHSCRVKSIKDIEKSGITSPLPKLIKRMITLQHFVYYNRERRSK